MNDCKYAKKFDDKHIKCKRDGSLRNQKKNKCCPYQCHFYERKLWKRIQDKINDIF